MQTAGTVPSPWSYHLQGTSQVGGYKAKSVLPGTSSYSVTDHDQASISYMYAEQKDG